MSSLNEVFLLNNKGPWKTKSSAELNVLYGLDFNFIQKAFFNYQVEELKKIKYDIRGLRTYLVSNIPKDSIGANEWHKVRSEIVVTIQGSVEWELTGMDGSQKTFKLNQNQGIYIPSHILHKYKALSDSSSILVVANTLFDPDDATTHDTFDRESFMSKIAV